MKPRLEPVPYTPEDEDIWICVGLTQEFALNDKLELASAIGDSRDADLMLHLTRYSIPGHPPTAHLVLRVDIDYAEHWRHQLVQHG